MTTKWGQRNKQRSPGVALLLNYFVALSFEDDLIWNHVASHRIHVVGLKPYQTTIRVERTTSRADIYAPSWLVCYHSRENPWFYKDSRFTCVFFFFFFFLRGVQFWGFVFFTPFLFCFECFVGLSFFFLCFQMKLINPWRLLGSWGFLKWVEESIALLSFL